MTLPPHRVSPSMILLTLQFSLALLNTPNHGILQCWDNCFNPSALQTLRQGGKARRHGFTSVMDSQQPPPRSILEMAICSLLKEMDINTNSLFVEYWWKDVTPPRMLEAHRDIDETYCSTHQIPIALGSDIKIGQQQCPSFGHVLYVHVDQCRAPTLVFQEENGRDGGGGPPRELEKLWVVPAVSNRLLRFRGDCLHAVAHPPLGFLPKTFQDGSLQSNNQDGRRAVLLFNTWKDEPPSFPPVGEDLSSSETNLFSTVQTTSKCRSLFEWTPCRASHFSNNQNNLVPMRVPLLGDISRRACLEDSLVSYVDRASATAALASKNTVHCVNLFSSP